MQSSMEAIKNLLKRYQFYRLQAENGLGGDLLQRKIQFLENSISVLNEDDYKLITGIFIDGTSVAKMAKILFIHRVTVYRRVDEIVKKIAEVYEMQFGT